MKCCWSKQGELTLKGTKSKVLDYDKRTPLEIPTAFGGEAGSGDERSSFISEKLIEYGNSTHYTNTCILTFFFSCSKNTRDTRCHERYL